MIAVAILFAAQAATAPATARAALPSVAPAATTPLQQAMETIGDCPHGKNDEIVVCRRNDPAKRFRIPEGLRDQGFDIHGSVDSVSRERNRLMEEGNSGVTSCTMAGTNGHIGCEIKKYHDWWEQKGGH